ncbi:hypothetical protein N7U66_13795 [Lacinutrix neustonica]|uniref:Tetratricopeptide repeat protein n=1 Tax=Lacinutrix neustonica TaxID=2980107 RepID=A0A9E8MTJ2_9FLAO|nr:hypothetical protein [Lacinutrix neustonica]WAC01198.1 hypothetical protein N7U66_13795 [Lacinutrix neustonica]
MANLTHICLNFKIQSSVTYILLIAIMLLICFSCNDKGPKLQNSNTALLKSAYDHLKSGDSLLFKTANKKALQSSVRLRDTSGIAETDWNYAHYYAENEIYDSAYYYYYKSFKAYESVNDHYHTGKMLYNMAFIQSRFNDYRESEEKLFQAITKLKPLQKNTSLYRCYNLLGSIYMDIEDYDNSINFHNISLEYLKKVDQKKTFRSRHLK